MNVYDTLEMVKSAAESDEDFRRKLLETEHHANAQSEFCRICTEAGFPIDIMELIDAGEESYAAMRRSTNGGGENSPLLQGEDDLYEMFLVEIS